MEQEIHIIDVQPTNLQQLRDAIMLVWTKISEEKQSTLMCVESTFYKVLASLRSSITESKAVSVECPLPKPDWLLSRRLFCVRKAVTWLNTTRSSVFAMKGRRETGL